MVKFAVLCEWSLLWVSECMRQARDLPRHHSHLAQHYHERMMAQRMARVSYIQFTKQASLAHHVKILVWSTNSSKKLRRKAQGARRLWPPCSDWTQKYFFNKVWESWWGMPQVKTSFSFNQQIHEKKCAERHRKLGGYSRHTLWRWKSEYFYACLSQHTLCNASWVPFLIFKQTQRKTCGIERLIDL